MPEKIDVNWNPANGALTVHCSAEMMARITQGVLNDVDEAKEIPLAEVNLLHFCRLPPAAPATVRWADRVGLVGCAIVGCVLMFVFAMGISQIARWFQ